MRIRTESRELTALDKREANMVIDAARDVAHRRYKDGNYSEGETRRYCVVLYRSK
jgi:uncharacterized protein with FMN-binding domain